MYIIATSSIGMTFGVWRSGHMTITAQFIARHFESICHTSYWPLGAAESTTSVHTQVSRYDPANIDDTIDYAFHDMQFTQMDLQEAIGEPGDVPPGGDSPFYSDEFHQPAEGALVDPPAGATFGPYAYPIVLSPEVRMVEEGQVCSVMIGAVVDVRSNFWQAPAFGDAFMEFHSLEVTIE